MQVFSLWLPSNPSANSSLMSIRRQLEDLSCCRSMTDTYLIDPALSSSQSPTASAVLQSCFHEPQGAPSNDIFNADTTALQQYSDADPAAYQFAIAVLQNATNISPSPPVDHKTGKCDHKSSSPSSSSKKGRPLARKRAGWNEFF